MLALKKLVAAKEIDRAMLRRGHQPGARIVRNAGVGPSLEGDNESVLRELLSQTNIANDAREAGDESDGLDSPDSVNDAMSFSR